MFGSLCYPTNDCDDLGKMKPKADIGIFIGYFKSSRGFCIYNRRTKNIMETIRVNFDEFTAMASECNNSGPSLNSLNFQDSSNDMHEIPLQQYLDNLFGPLIKEYYVPSTSKVSNNSTVNTPEVEDTPSLSSIIVEDSDASQIVTFSIESITQESSIPVVETHSDEQLQEDVAELDGNTIMHSFENPEFEEAESSSNYQDPSNISQELYNIPDGCEDCIPEWYIERKSFYSAGCLDDYKSTSRGLQFLGDKLVSWSLKKQNCTAMSTSKDEDDGEYLVLLNAWESNCWCSKIDMLLIAFHT
uniref:Integrase, catalytic region, zinc finger, CCHC-type, peptidase aspartic, catalytic n=1 Tax=Tanacetum cinerariifolium TaxID=118510 RepID=A0A6L2K3G2_TANCI|nr:integrase, catalytic region, zinc finger, CCHC-type, peptidase aspartic, catalytic [Tanacetum cinerariifolium]